MPATGGRVGSRAPARRRPGVGKAARLARRVRGLELLHDVSRRITALLDIKALLPELVEQLRSVLGVEIVSIMLPDETGKSLRIEAAAGLPVEVIERTRVPLGEGISGQVAVRGEPVFLRDLGSNREHAPSPYHAQYTTGSLICAPLRLGDRTLGVLNVNNRLDGLPLDETDLALVVTISSEAALALENSRIHGNLQAEVARVAGELQRSHDELRRLQEFNASILRNMPSGLVAVDAEAVVTLLNRAGADLLGVSEAGARGRSLAELFGAVPARQVLGEEAGTQTAARQEVVVTGAGGQELPLGFSTAPNRDAAGRLTGTIVLFQDLTRIKRMEAEILRMDRMASLGVLGAGIAHEIRNPLAAMRFSLTFLGQAIGSRPELEVILKNVDRLDDLVRQILRFARPATPALRVEAIGPHVAAVADLVGKQAAAAGIDLQLELDAELPLARIDGALIQQVVMNVVLNAMQGQPNGGRIHVRTFHDGGATGAGQACIEVTDEGPGLPPELRTRIFDPFFTTREAGTGLGLAVVQRIVQEHGGTIDVASPVRDGRGARFTIRVPAEPTRGED